MITWRDIKSTDIILCGINGLWLPSCDRILKIDKIELCGYCLASIGNPFSLYVEVKIDNVWKKICGIKSISNKEFNNSYDYPFIIKTDKSDGVTHVIRAISSGKNDIDFTISVIGLEYLNI